MHRLFVLSPANLDGVRGRRLTEETARFAVAEKLRRGSVSLGEAFCYISSLYFRAKLQYAERYATPCGELPGVLVLATGFGLVPPDWELDHRRLARMRRTPVDPSRPSFRRPIENDARQIAERLPDAGRVVFLGSLVPRKYLEVLAPILGDRLLVPEAFVGRGQMQRGSLLLKHLEVDDELPYIAPPGVARKVLARKVPAE